MHVGVAYLCWCNLITVCICKCTLHWKQLLSNGHIVVPKRNSRWLFHLRLGNVLNIVPPWHFDSPGPHKLQTTAGGQDTAAGEVAPWKRNGIPASGSFNIAEVVGIIVQIKSKKIKLENHQYTMVMSYLSTVTSRPSDELRDVGWVVGWGYQSPDHISVQM